MDITIHTNFNLPHQVIHAECFRQGFLNHGLEAEITSSIYVNSDIHIVMGPHYAKENWRDHNRVILLDRNYYHSSNDFISIGWMNKGGGRDFVEGTGRKPPEIKKTTGNKSIFLSDYNGIIESADIIRFHPENSKSKNSLSDDLKLCNRATGYNTTALVKAALEGLEINCKGKTSILKNKNWLNLLPYADWHYNEIISGEVWEHLQLSMNQA